jgi:hypothetical protein
MNRIICIMLLALISHAAMAAQGTTVYKSEDGSGAPVFTDRGSSASEEIIIQDPITFPPAVFEEDDQGIDYQNMQSEQDAPGITSYGPISIASPADQDVIRNNAGNLTVKGILPNRISSDHQARLLLDGKVVALYQGTSFQLQNIDRGTHTLQLEIVDRKSRKVLNASNPISVTLLRYSTRMGKPTPH